MDYLHNFNLHDSLNQTKQNLEMMITFFETMIQDHSQHKPKDTRYWMSLASLLEGIRVLGGRG